MFIPDDVRLRKFGAAIAEQRRHCLRKESRDATTDTKRSDDGEPAAKKTETERDLSEQLSLFAPISATPLDEHGRPLEAPRIYEADVSADADPNGEIPDFVGAAELADVAARHLRAGLRRSGRVPPPVADPIPVAPAKSGALARRRQLREQNSDGGHRSRPPHRPHPRRHQRAAQSKGGDQTNRHGHRAPARTAPGRRQGDAPAPLTISQASSAAPAVT